MNEKKTMKMVKVHHDRSSLYEAVTGNFKEIAEDFLTKFRDQISDYMQNLSVEEGRYRESHIFEFIMKHPDLSLNEKMFLIYDFGKSSGVKQGSDAVCDHCVVGPAAKFLHSLSPKQ